MARSCAVVSCSSRAMRRRSSSCKVRSRPVAAFSASVERRTSVMSSCAATRRSPAPSPKSGHAELEPPIRSRHGIGAGVFLAEVPRLAARDGAYPVADPARDRRHVPRHVANREVVRPGPGRAALGTLFRRAAPSRVRGDHPARPVEDGDLGGERVEAGLEQGEGLPRSELRPPPLRHVDRDADHAPLGAVLVLLRNALRLHHAPAGGHPAQLSTGPSPQETVLGLERDALLHRILLALLDAAAVVGMDQLEPSRAQFPRSRRRAIEAEKGVHLR